MEKDITAERTANAIMLNTSFEGHHLIVEGKKDQKVYEKFINDKEIIIQIAFGKEKVKEIIRILTERGFNRKIGIIDADFIRINEEEDIIDGLFITDDHDIEVMIIKTQALENVLNTVCSKPKITAFEKESRNSVRNQIFILAKEIAYLKLANKLYDLGLVFKPKNPEGKQIKYKKFICDKTLKYLGDEKFIDTVFNYSNNKTKNLKSKEFIDIKLSAIKKKEYPIDQLVCGHDLTNVLFFLMRKILNSGNKMLQCADAVEYCLMLAYEFNDFKKTNLFAEIKNWALKNEVTIFSRN